MVAPLGITRAQPHTFAARLYAPLWRLMAAGLGSVSRTSLPALLVLVVVANDPPISTLQLLQLLLLLALLPALGVRLIRRTGAAVLERSAVDLIARRADLLVEIPYGAIARVAPWVVPLPGAGLTLWMRSGRRLRYAIQIDDPRPLLDALAGAVGGAAAAAQHPSVAYAHAAAGTPPWRWYHYGWKFVLFALAPGAVFFNAHQHIAYGGPLGEYYLLGLAAYLQTFAFYWATLAVYLVLFASLWRGAAEAAALVAAWAAPSHAARVRHAAELWCRILYYAGVPALVAVRFLT